MPNETDSIMVGETALGRTLGQLYLDSRGLPPAGWSCMNHYSRCWGAPAPSAVRFLSVGCAKRARPRDGA